MVTFRLLCHHNLKTAKYPVSLLLSLIPECGQQRNNVYVVPFELRRGRLTNCAKIVFVLFR